MATTLSKDKVEARKTAENSTPTVKPKTGVKRSAEEIDTPASKKAKVSLDQWNAM